MICPMVKSECIMAQCKFWHSGSCPEKVANKIEEITRNVAEVDRKLQQLQYDMNKLKYNLK